MEDEERIAFLRKFLSEHWHVVATAANSVVQATAHRVLGVSEGTDAFAVFFEVPDGRRVFACTLILHSEGLVYDIDVEGVTRMKLPDMERSLQQWVLRNALSEKVPEFKVTLYKAN